MEFELQHVKHASAPMRRRVDAPRFLIEVPTNSSLDIIDLVNIDSDIDNGDEETTTKNVYASESTDATTDRYRLNAFLTQKLQTESLLEDENMVKVPKPLEDVSSPKQEEPDSSMVIDIENKKRYKKSSTSENNATQVDEKENEKKITISLKRKASPIVYNVDKRLKNESVTKTHEYDAAPELKPTERKIIWCRAFPACQFGASCAYTHPRCKFLAACTRRNCVYSHSPDAPTASGSVLPSVASHVVPVAKYKKISSVVPNKCKFYPNCMNPSCHFYHPKPCRYGNNCANKFKCKFFHAGLYSKRRYTIDNRYKITRYSSKK